MIPPIPTGLRKALGIHGRIRRREYANLYAGTLLEFKHEGFGWQMDFMESGYVTIVVGEVVTGIPELGWIRGDWISIGAHPSCYPALGSAYDKLPTHPFTGMLVYRHPKTPIEAAQRIIDNSAVVACVGELQLGEIELMIFGPKHFSLNSNGREGDMLLASIPPLCRLAKSLS